MRKSYDDGKPHRGDSAHTATNRAANPCTSDAHGDCDDDGYCYAVANGHSDSYPNIDAHHYRDADALTDSPASGVQADP